MSAEVSLSSGPVLIVGGGEVGCRAVEASLEAGVEVFLVDRRSSCSARHLVPEGNFITAGIEGGLELAERIAPRWVIPAIPRHLAAEWLFRRWPDLAPDSAELARIRPGLPPDILLPGDSSSATFLLSLSPADQICPADCLPPGNFCALTGEPREASLFERISEALAGRAGRTFILESCQVAPGLGAILWKELSAMLSCDPLPAGSTVAVVTASACHGVGNIFRVMKNVVE